MTKLNATITTSLLTIALLAACGNTELPSKDANAKPEVPITQPQGPGVQPGDPNAKRSYIVIYKDSNFGGLKVQSADITSASLKIAGVSAAEITNTYESALKGAAINLTAAQAEKLKADPRVASVQEDFIVKLEADETPNLSAIQPVPSSWGLDRIDQRSRPLNNAYSYDSDGTGVNVYVLDTGIRASHQEFGGRARVAFNASGDTSNGVDCNGHGTHVAGTIGGSSMGVAKNVRINAVKVFPNCDGTTSTSTLLAGIDWVTRNHVKPAVANFSIGGGVNPALDTGVRNAITAGVTFVVAAGNASVDAASTSPARVSEAITVGSSDSNDARSGFSNFGTALDVFAPGSSIISAGITSDSALANLSGTSMAAPHVTGAVARYLQNNRTASPAAAAQAIVNAATPSVITDIQAGSPNRLLYATPQVVQPGQSQRALGWVWADQPSAASYTPALAYQFNRNQSGIAADNTITKLGLGRYRVDFKNFNTLGGTAHVSAYGGNHYCKVENWTAEVSVNVACFAANGTPVDGLFTATYYKDDPSKPTTKSNAYLWSNQAVGATGSTYSPVATFQFNSKRLTNTVTFLETGHYKIHLPGLSTQGRQLGLPLANAYGSGSVRCNPGNWTFSASELTTEVWCFDANGNPTPSQFTLSFTREAGNLGSISNSDTLEAFYAWPWSAYHAYQSDSYGRPANASDPFQARTVRTGVGAYSMTLPGVKAYGKSTTMLSGYSAAAADSGYCSIAGWGQSATVNGTDVNVSCFNKSGQPVDGTYFTLYYYTDQTIR